MRFAPLFALAAGLSLLAATAYEADAQNIQQRQRIIVKKRSYLDPGTEVKPGSKSYHDYAFDRSWRYPTLGVDPTGHVRYPLPGQFELPGF